MPGTPRGERQDFSLVRRDVLCRKATVKLRPGWRGRKDQPRRGGGGAGSSPGGVGEVQGAAQVGWGGAGSIPAPVIGLPSLPGPSKQVRAIGAGGVHLEFAEGRRSGQNRAEKRGRTAPWRGLEAVSPLDPTPWAAESTAGGLSVRAPCCVGDRWQRRRPRHRRLVRSLPQWPRRQGGPGLRSGGREVWEGARPCGEAAADGAS